MSSFKASPMSRQKIREITKKLRELFKIDNSVEFPIVKNMEYLFSGLDENDYTLLVCEKNEMGDNYAVTIPSEKIIKIREDVYKKACEGNPRHLFTMSHEFGHVVFHSNTTIALARGDEQVKPFEDPEWQANTFAAELMAPADVICGMTVEEIMNRYQCSYEVANIQLQQSKKYMKKATK